MFIVIVIIVLCVCFNGTTIIRVIITKNVSISICKNSQHYLTLKKTGNNTYCTYCWDTNWTKFQTTTLERNIGFLNYVQRFNVNNELCVLLNNFLYVCVCVFECAYDFDIVQYIFGLYYIKWIYFVCIHSGFQVLLLRIVSLHNLYESEWERKSEEVSSPI